MASSLGRMAPQAAGHLIQYSAAEVQGERHGASHCSTIPCVEGGETGISRVGRLSVLGAVITTMRRRVDHECEA